MKSQEPPPPPPLPPLAPLPPPPDKTPISIQADGENRYENGIAVATRNVVVKYKGDLIYADRITYDSKSKLIMCRGNVRIFSDTKVYRGESMDYNFKTKAMTSLDFRTSDFPTFMAGDTLVTLDPPVPAPNPPEPNHYRIHNGTFTTDNRESPGWRLQANTVEIYPDDEVVLKNVRLYVGEVPVLWLPFYVKALDDNRQTYDWSAGYSGRFGAYYYNKFNWWESEKLQGTVHFDIREKRGYAGGLDMRWTPNNQSYLNFKAYYAQDNLYSDPSLVNQGSDAKYASPGVPDDSRYRVSVQSHLQVLPDLYVLTDINKWSDPYVLKDFAEAEYVNNIEPDNVVEVVQYDPNWTVDVLVREQINRFFESVNRSPEVKFESKRQKIFNSPIAYEGETSIDNLKRDYADVYGQPASVNPNYSSYRWDTFHQFLYPKQYWNWLSFTPRVGLRGTAWSDDNQNLEDIGPGGSNEDHPRGRFVFNVGWEADFRMSRVWSNVQSEKWGIDGLRHVIEPYANMQYIPGVVGANPDDIRGFDDRLPSTNLQPINFPAWNSIDDIDRQFVTRIGVRNKLQTKRDGVNVDLIDWATYFDVDLDSNFSVPANLGSSTNNISTVSPNGYLSNIFSDLTILPLPWLYFNSRLSYDTAAGNITEFNNSLSWQVNRALRLGVGNQYIQDSVLFPDSNLLNINAFYRMNEHWQFAAQASFELRNGDLQGQDYRIPTQTYTIYRDLSSWLAALNFGRRDIGTNSSNGQPQTETLVYLTLTLKAFPGTNLSTSSFGSSVGTTNANAKSP